MIRPDVDSNADLARGPASRYDAFVARCSRLKYACIALSIWMIGCDFEPQNSSQAPSVNADSVEPSPSPQAPGDTPERAGDTVSTEGRPETAQDEVVLYGASWCGACRQARAYFRRRQIAFVDRDIERDPGAREAMQAAARRAGLTRDAIPIIDFRGTVLQGFNSRRLNALAQRGELESILQ